jgi:flavin reductase (DIM6/NTAB) family NADH-FMN oxidoreductase RutF
MTTISIDKDKIQSFEKQFRTQLINSLPGLKPLVLVGTTHASGVANLALFNSVVHIGADPPLLGLIVRPDSVPRHTLINIQRELRYSLNVVHERIVAQAHQCSARLGEEMSEFDDAGLTLQYNDGFPSVPFVSESMIQIAMHCQEIIKITSNNTLMVIGCIENIWLPENALQKDGTVDHFTLNSAVCQGLDTYGTGTFQAKLPYAKPGQLTPLLTTQ